MELSILNLMLVLLAAWIAGSLLSRVGLPSILGELLAGVVLGPPLLGLIHDSASLDVLAQVGVLIMMLYVGMEIEPRELGKASWGGLLAAAGGFITPFLLTFLAVKAFGGSTVAAVVTGNVVGITSLTANSRILLDLRLLDTRIAHVLMAGALIADTFGLLFFAGLLGVVEMGSADLSHILIETAKGVLFLGLTASIGIWVFPWVGRSILDRFEISRTTLFMMVLVIGLFFGELAELAGLHAILGTFLVGMFLKNAIPERRMARDLQELVHDVSIGFLAPVFFIIAGFDVSLAVFQTDLGLLIAIVAAAMVGKVAGAALFYLPTGNGWREGLTIGAGMNGHAAVEIIIAGIALQMGLISREIFSILVVMAILTTLTVPALLKVLTDWLRERGELVRAEKRSGVLIVGAGPTARLLARQLAASEKVWMVDSNERLCRAARGQERLTVVCGNALREEVLAEANAAHVRHFLAVTSNPEVNVLAAQIAREVFLVPDIHVTLLGSGSEAYRELIEPIEASPLFGASTDLVTWDRRIATEHFEIIEQPIDRDEITVEEVVANFEEGRKGLPLMVARGEECLFFHSDLDLDAGDRLFVAVPREERRQRDAFDGLVEEAPVLDLPGSPAMEAFFRMAAETLSAAIGDPADELVAQLLQREKEGSTVLGPNLAVPHILLEDGRGFHLLIARCQEGVWFPDMEAKVHTVFVLAGGRDERTLHLRALSAIAQIVQSPGFEDQWLEAGDTEDLRRLVLSAERRRL